MQVIALSGSAEAPVHAKEEDIPSVDVLVTWTLDELHKKLQVERVQLFRTRIEKALRRLKAEGQAWLQAVAYMRVRLFVTVVWQTPHFVSYGCVCMQETKASKCNKKRDKKRAMKEEKHVCKRAAEMQAREHLEWISEVKAAKKNVTFAQRERDAEAWTQAQVYLADMARQLKDDGYKTHAQGHNDEAAAWARVQHEMAAEVHHQDHKLRAQGVSCPSAAWLRAQAELERMVREVEEKGHVTHLFYGWGTLSPYGNLTIKVNPASHMAYECLSPPPHPLHRARLLILAPHPWFL